MRVKPGQPGLKVRDPENSQYIPAEGIELKPGVNETYWFRRIKCGDVVIVEEESPSEEISNLNQAGGADQ